MSDFRGNNFICKIELVKKSTPGDAQEEGEDDDGWASLDVDELIAKQDEKSEKILATFPCAPALFGPTHIAELVLSNGLKAEARIQAPISGDEYGCKGGGTEPLPTIPELMPMKIEDEIPMTTDAPTTPDAPDEVDGDATNEADNDVEESPVEDDSDHTCKNSVVQIIRRGVCTFQEKSLNQRNGIDADAVIVINSDDEELFVMSGGGPEDPTIDADYPATVLVTGQDGKQLLDLAKLQANDDETTQLHARVTLTPDRAEIVESGEDFSVVGNKNWPALRVTPQVVQLFAKGGWGVHAVKTEKGAKDPNNMEWQLYVMQHKLPAP